MRLQAVYYRNPHGQEPVRDFLEQLQPRARAAIDLQIDRLNALNSEDPPPPFPHSSQIAGELRELRCHYGRHLVRILYRRSRSLIVLLHAFDKRAQQVSAQDQAIAQERWSDFLERIEAHPRAGPRPAGHDAP